MNRGNRVLAVNAPLCSQELPHRKMLFQKPLRPDKGKPPGRGGGYTDPALFNLQTTGSTKVILSALYQDQRTPKCWLSRSFKCLHSHYSVFFNLINGMNRSTKPSEYAKGCQKDKTMSRSLPRLLHFWLNQAQWKDCSCHSGTTANLETHALTVD